MIYTIPHYYKQFRCIASGCPDTCCAGWAIMIDRKALENYRHMEGPFGNRLHNSIDWKESSFRQYEGRCAFLNEDNLCDIYAETGPENLCRTCRTYPRHIEEFEGCREISLCMSCIEAAKLILGCEEPVRFITKEDGKEESYGDFDFFLYTKLMDTRELALSMLQDRSMDISMRISMCLALAHDLERRIRLGRLFEADALLTRYAGSRDGDRAKQERDGFFRRKLADYRITPGARHGVMKEMFGIFKDLEVLGQDWPDFASRADRVLYAEGETAYGEMRTAFLDGPAAGRLPLWREQLMVYFVFTYFCGAVYNNSPFRKMKMAAAGTLLIEELAMAAWQQHGRQMGFLDFVDVAHRFSREVEHSDINKGCLEERMAKGKAFSLERLLNAVNS